MISVIDQFNPDEKVKIEYKNNPKSTNSFVVFTETYAYEVLTYKFNNEYCAVHDITLKDMLIPSRGAVVYEIENTKNERTTL